MPSLSVDLNRDRPHDLAVEGDLTVRGPFRVEFENHGEAVHVHLSVDDDLARVVNLGEPHHFAEGGETLVVAVDVYPQDDPVTGVLTLSTSFGSQSETVRVTVEPNPKVTQGVDVDESLSRPQRTSAEQSNESSAVGSLSRLELTALTLLAVVAVALALVVSVVVDAMAAAVGVAVVLFGVLAAAFIVLQ